ncbi:hypothetical protein CO669_32565 [Bradyrhizobium sp. Y36]|uniref:hypothetical protein n=1 Tax=Bradyrhizobium sp. Y36 TaxID=2035447 RepID=UPI000BE84985|nr:hypothetical protein [Bradyrhizobium sp. Y36]PDT82779.1 hypothetical protein CO669_33985 [Bradyrhizobium sp. Y36]PDT84060.1 hypothetical protein CO669_32565 [Bradyrhizobium sp. Y36]
MTDYSTQKLQCYCCGKASEHSVLMSSNSRGSPDLDQRPPKMYRWTIGSWLQECPYCGYVAPDIDKGDAKARKFFESDEFRVASLDPSPDPVTRRFLVRAAQHAYQGERRLAFLSTLSAAWVADDANQPTEAASLRLRAARHLEGPRITSIDTRLLLLDVLRRASSWEAAEALAVELAAEELGYPFAEIVAFHRDKIAARDDERYTIGQALEGKPPPALPTTAEDQELIKAIARHIKIVPNPRRT